MRIVQQDFSDIEKLKRVETEEAIKVGILKPEMPLVYSSSDINESSVFIID